MRALNGYLDEYRVRLEYLQDELKTLPFGDETAANYEALCGEIIQLCLNSVSGREEHGALVWQGA